jgi:hypothetical protein
MEAKQQIPSDPITAALRNYSQVVSYQVTLRSKTSRSSEELRYYYESGYVRIEFISPFPGVLVTYDPVRKKARLRPFPRLPKTVTLDPENGLLRSASGHTVNNADIGSLLRVVAQLQSNGTTSIIREESLGLYETLFVVVEGNDKFTAHAVHRYHLWLDKETYLPLKLISYDLTGAMIEEIRMDDLEINVEFPHGFFGM